MTWRHYLTDAVTGGLIRPIDIPSFSWSMTVGSFGFSTTSKDPGEMDESNITVPFSQFDTYDGTGRLTHRATTGEINSLLSIGRRGLCSTWAYPGCDDERGTPIMWGALGDREDHWLDTTFPVISPMDLLGDRYAIRDGAFKDGRSTDTLAWQDLSFRALACELIRIGTSAKNGGSLPFDLPYLGEKGTHQRTDYKAWNVQNLSVKKLLTDMTNVQHGVDMGFRPRFDGNRVVCGFIAGSDGDIYLDAGNKPMSLSVSPYGGSMELTAVNWQHAIQRWYGTGAGTDESVVTALAEDLGQITGHPDPPILRENVFSDTDASAVDVLKPKLMALLASNRLPIAQVTGVIHVNDLGPNGLPIHPLGSFWPGNRVDVDISGHRTLPDDRYPMRLMAMNGDETDAVTLKFDVFQPGF